MFGQRVLVLVPHPDDEIVACAASIGRAQANGAEIFALYLTHGCIAKETLWLWQRGTYDQNVRRRRNEGDRAAQFLHITPLGWSLRPARHLWHHMPAVAAEILTAIHQYAIDQIWVPAYEGGNADHDALNAIATLFQKQVSVLEFAEYNFFDRRTHVQAFPYPNGNEQTITLTPLEQKKKRMALALYKSERRNLNYVGVERECFRQLAFYDYSKPPHPGTLWYARFQWVPFPHPHVDFTKAEDVCKAIGTFLK